MIILNRLNVDRFINNGHVGDVRNPDLSVFLLNDAETQMLRENYKVLAGRVIVEFLKKFNFLSSIIPDHICHEYQDEMSKKSIIVPMPLLQIDEKYYNDMVDILDQDGSAISTRRQE